MNFTSSALQYALLAAAHALLRVLPPLRAHALLVRAGSLLPQIRSPEEARDAYAKLSGHGTCLSRALAVAARAPTADLVIGVAPGGSSPLFAHAWLEMDGVSIDASEVAGAAIARIRGPRSTSAAPAR